MAGARPKSQRRQSPVQAKKSGVKANDSNPPSKSALIGRLEAKKKAKADRTT